jgi:hypothetical protein
LCAIASATLKVVRDLTIVLTLSIDRGGSAQQSPMVNAFTPRRGLLGRLAAACGGSSPIGLRSG